MTDVVWSEFCCDLCGTDEAIEIEVLRRYSGGMPIHVCRNCGFVYVRRRRTAQVIAEVWSKELFQADYTARIPAVKARQLYVAETIDVELGLKGKALCDIGGGEGQFLEMVMGPEYGAKVFTIEPSPENCQRLNRSGIEYFLGTIEDFRASPKRDQITFDIVTIMWTLESCQDCRGMLKVAWEMLPTGGHLVIATGSRLLVPFKKPLQGYVRTNPTDAHPFRFSANTLRAMLAVCGFETTFINRYLDSDYLCVIGRKLENDTKVPWKGDDYRQVLDFFIRWDKESREHYSDFVYCP